jgi:hypothetical protein
MAGTYFFALNWKKSAIARAMPAATAVPFRPKPKLTFKKSEAVSPTVVHRTLMIQKKIVTPGTLHSISLRGVASVFDAAAVGWTCASVI